MRLVNSAFLLLALLVDGGCDRGADGPDAPAATLVRVGGDWQRAPGLARLDDPLAIRVIDPVTLAPLADVSIQFAIERGAGSGARLTDTLAITNRDGLARTELTLGSGAADTVVVAARIARGPTERFHTLVLPTPVVRRVEPPDVRAGDTVTLFGTGLALAADPGAVEFGDVRAHALTVSDTAVRTVVPPCLAPGEVAVTVARRGARAVSATVHNTVRSVPVTLAPLQGIVLYAAQLSDCITLAGAGARYLMVAQIENDVLTPDAVDVDIAAGGTPAGVRTFAATPVPAAASTSLRFERVLRGRESALAATGLSRAALRAPSPLPSVGTIDTFRVISTIDARNFATATARLRYAGQHILVWVDTLAPREVTDSTLDALARLFDEELFPLDEDTFGETSDVDGNGRVHVVLTPIVNGLTATTQCSLSGFVGGFFSAHDLFPGAANANGGEVFYGFVSDSLGRFGCKHPPSEFTSAIRAAFVHELQHLINFQQHVFRRGGREEVDWLNEGMSHMAEELASKMYERRFPPPAGRASADQLFPDSSQSFIVYNLINAYLYLYRPYANSLTHFTQGGTIEERGAAWLFLRWLADQYGEDILRRIVQTPMTSKANIEDKTGESFSRLIGDFAIAVYADSLPGIPRSAIPPRWRFRTRNWRVIFQRLNVVVGFPPFPIEPTPVPFGGSVTGPLRIGGFVALLIDVPAGATTTTLRFVPHGGGAWPAGQAPQVSLFRLP